MQAAKRPLALHITVKPEGASGATMAQLHRSDYKDFFFPYLPGQFISIRLKIEQNCCFFLDIFSSAIKNDLSSTVTSRLKVDVSSEIGSRWRTILGHPQLTEYMGICILTLAHGSEQRGSDVICLL